MHITIGHFALDKKKFYYNKIFANYGVLLFLSKFDEQCFKEARMFLRETFTRWLNEDESPAINQTIVTNYANESSDPPAADCPAHQNLSM